MAPLEIFLIPGHYAFKLILLFLQIPAYQVEPGLAKVFAFILSLIIWAWLFNVCSSLIKRLLGFDNRNRY